MSIEKDVNALKLATYERKQDRDCFEFNDTYQKMRSYLSELLLSADCIDDIESDVIFEIEYYINANDYNVDAHDIADELYDDFNLKGAV